MREIRSSGSVRGVRSNSYPYRDLDYREGQNSGDGTRPRFTGLLDIAKLLHVLAFAVNVEVVISRLPAGASRSSRRSGTCFFG